MQKRPFWISYLATAALSLTKLTTGVVYCVLRVTIKNQIAYFWHGWILTWGRMVFPQEVKTPCFKGWNLRLDQPPCHPYPPPSSHPILMRHGPLHCVSQLLSQTKADLPLSASFHDVQTKARSKVLYNIEMFMGHRHIRVSMITKVKNKIQSIFQVLWNVIFVFILWNTCECTFWFVKKKQCNLYMHWLYE